MELKGTEAEIKCVSESPVTWFRNEGEPLQDTAIKEPLNVLRLRNLHSSDSGAYTCLGTSNGQELKSTTQLYVIGKTKT